MGNMDGKYIIMVKFGGSSEQCKRVCEIIDTNTKDDDFQSLRYATLDLHNCDEFEESSIDLSLARDYLGIFVKNKMAYRGYTILSLERFPTQFFEAIEEQFPGVTIALTCWTTNGVISYTNDEWALDKVCYPEIINPDGTPYCSQRLNHGLHHVSNRLRVGNSSAPQFVTHDNIPESNLENTPIWVVKEVSSLPDENPKMKIELWNPVQNNYVDSDLQISDEEMRIYFPNYFKAIEKKRLLEKEARGKVPSNPNKLRVTKNKNDIESDKASIVGTKSKSTIKFIIWALLALLALILFF